MVSPAFIILRKGTDALKSPGKIFKRIWRKNRRDGSAGEWSDCLKSTLQQGKKIAGPKATTVSQPGLLSHFSLVWNSLQLDKSRNAACLSFLFHWLLWFKQLLQLRVATLQLQTTNLWGLARKPFFFFFLCNSTSVWCFHIMNPKEVTGEEWLYWRVMDALSVLDNT